MHTTLAPETIDLATTRTGLTRAPRWKRFALIAVVQLIILTVTLAVLDVALIALGLFPPTTNPGDAKVGWLSAVPTGEMHDEGCLNLTTKEIVSIRRNEDGMRTSHSSALLSGSDDLLKIAVSGDSHTELCVPTEQTHYGATERELRAAGVAAATFANGAGKYSPLQAYLAVRPAMARYSADVFVLNLYTGNDFYDMLRVDDRPHFVSAASGGYRIADPVWYRLDPPDEQPRSRVLFVLRSAAKKVGIERMFLRLQYLRDAAAARNAGVGAIVGYMNDLRKAGTSKVEYSHAFAAQMLNQQLFFHRFPGSREESVARVRALMEMVRREQPGKLLVMSPIPSYQLVNQRPNDAVLQEVIGRLPVTYEGGVAEEGELYTTLKTLAAETGWIFVDNLGPLRAYSGQEALYNTVDYHIEPAASNIIGAVQATAIRAVRHAPKTFE